MMEQGTAATPDELQQAINSITSGAAAASAADVSAAAPVEAVDATADTAVDSVADTAVDSVADTAVDPVVEAAAAAAAAAQAAAAEPTKAQYGDPDLDKVKSMALSDLRPIMEKVDLPAEKKFMIYKDILELTEDKACVEPAYNAASQIADDKARGEALIFIVEYIDRLGIQMTIGSEEEEEQ